MALFPLSQGAAILLRDILKAPQMFSCLIFSTTLLFIRGENLTKASHYLTFIKVE